MSRNEIRLRRFFVPSDFARIPPRYPACQVLRRVSVPDCSVQPAGRDAGQLPRPAGFAARRVRRAELQSHSQFSPIGGMAFPIQLRPQRSSMAVAGAFSFVRCVRRGGSPCVESRLFRVRNPSKSTGKCAAPCKFAESVADQRRADHFRRSGALRLSNENRGLACTRPQMRRGHGGPLVARQERAACGSLRARHVRDHAPVSTRGLSDDLPCGAEGGLRRRQPLRLQGKEPA